MSRSTEQTVDMQSILCICKLQSSPGSNNWLLDRYRLHDEYVYLNPCLTHNPPCKVDRWNHSSITIFHLHVGEIPHISESLRAHRSRARCCSGLPNFSDVYPHCLSYSFYSLHRCWLSIGPCAFHSFMPSFATAALQSGQASISRLSTGTECRSFSGVTPTPRSLISLSPLFRLPILSDLDASQQQRVSQGIWVSLNVDWEGVALGLSVTRSLACAAAVAFSTPMRQE